MIVQTVSYSVHLYCRDSETDPSLLCDRSPSRHLFDLPLGREETVTRLLDLAFPPHTKKTKSAMASQELASTYAALILADDGVEITVRRQPCPLPFGPLKAASADNFRYASQSEKILVR